MNLEELTKLGVTELQVTKGSAVAVNPYEKWQVLADVYNPEWVTFRNLYLPPFPTSGIPDGIVKIEKVEEVRQYFCPAEKKWVDDSAPYHNYGVRTALRKQQPEEVKPGEMQTDNIPKWMRDHASRLAKEIRGEDSYLPQPEQPEPSRKEEVNQLNNLNKDNMKKATLVELGGDFTANVTSETVEFNKPVTNLGMEYVNELHKVGRGDKLQLPSFFRIGDIVDVNYGDAGIIKDAEITGVLFDKGSVYYNVEVCVHHQEYTLIERIQATFIKNKNQL